MDFSVVQQPDKIRHWQSREFRARAHCQLVAEVARRRLSHSRNSHVFAQSRSSLEIEIVQRHDAIDAAIARQMTHRQNRVVQVPLLVYVRHVEDFVDALRRPVRGFHQAFGRKQEHCSALSLTLAQELVPFFVARDAQDSERVGSCHSRGGSVMDAQQSGKMAYTVSGAARF